MGDSNKTYNSYRSKRQRTEKMLQEICANNRRITIDTSKVKSTPIKIDDKRVMSIYYRSDAVRIDVVIASELYAIAMQLEREGIAYQKPSANPFASSGVYAFFIDEENEEKAYKRFFEID